MTDTQQSQLEGLYEKVPRLSCQGKCSHCCEPFRIGRAEWVRIEAASGPQIVTERSRCPLLSVDGKCSVHPIRPMLCRLWYTVENNPCPHGCKPDRWLTEGEARELLFAANAISGHEFAGPCTEMERLEQEISEFLQACEA